MKALNLIFLLISACGTAFFTYCYSEHKKQIVSKSIAILQNLSEKFYVIETPFYTKDIALMGVITSILLMLLALINLLRPSRLCTF